MSDKPIISDAYWSAAFISYCVKLLQQTYPAFPWPAVSFGETVPPQRRAYRRTNDEGSVIAINHMTYTEEIRKNPSIYNKDNKGWSVLEPFPAGERPTSVKRGDIIVQLRGTNSVTLRSPVLSGEGHADIVTRAAGFGFEMIGGNRVGPGSSAAGIAGGYVNRTDESSLPESTIAILRYYEPIVAGFIADNAEREFLRWTETVPGNRGGARRFKQGFIQGQTKGNTAINLYWKVGCGLNYIPSAVGQTSTLLPATINQPDSSPNASITPYIHSLESFHPNIQYELTRRRIAANTVNTYTPFVKLTSLTKILPENLPSNVVSAWCPSLGIHGEEVVDFDDIYSTKNNRSIIGIAQTGKDGKEKTRILVKENNTTDQKNIPVPGISQITVDRGTAGPMGVRGGLVKADLKILAYSVGQVDALLRYFLRPATRVVLELGRRSAIPNLEESNLKTFNWKQPQEQITNYFSNLVTSVIAQRKFIYDYIHSNYGNYELFLGYVVKFNLKYTKDNIYEISLTVHSVQQFELPTRHTGVKSTCPDPTNGCRTMDIQEYFSNGSAWKDNSFSRLLKEYGPGSRSDWRFQIVPIKNSQTDSNGGGSTQGGTRENEYYVSWRFFIEKILHDKKYGLVSVASNINNEPLENFSTLALPRIVPEPSALELRNTPNLYANEVGYHPSLRSTNPGVMIIYNPAAQQKYEQSKDYPRFQLLMKGVDKERTEGQESGTRSPSVFSIKNIDELISRASVPFTNLLDVNTKAGASFLTRGVWLNTAAIKQAFSSADTLSAGLDNLLNMMNDATEGFWNLQLYSTDKNNPGMHVIDMGLSKPPSKVATYNKIKNWIDLEEDEQNSPLNSVLDIPKSRYVAESSTIVERPKYIYMFNRKTKIFNDGELGSDLIDLNVEFNLPQVVAVQAIANVGGPAQKSLLQSINIEELKDISLLNNLYINCNSRVNEICLENEGPCVADGETSEADIDIAALELKIRRQSLEVLAALKLEGVTGTPNTSGQSAVNEASTIEAFTIQWLQSDAGISNSMGGQHGGGGNAAVASALNSLRVLKSNLSSAIESRSITVAMNTLGNGNAISTVRQYADLGTALRFIEPNPATMVKTLNLDSTNAEEGRAPAVAHAFNSSNLTKTTVDVTLPGIGGIELFQSFLVDRVPSILERGFYVVTKITHEFTTNAGWITKLQGRFRFRPDKATSGEYDICVGTSATPSTVGNTGQQGIDWKKVTIPLTASQLTDLIKKFQTDNGITPVNGNVGPKTRAALKIFQTSNNISSDGGIGRSGQTAPLLLKLLQEGKSLRVSPAGSSGT